MTENGEPVIPRCSPTLWHRSTCRLRMLAWEQNERARVSYQDPNVRAERFGIPAEIPADADALIGNPLA